MKRTLLAIAITVAAPSIVAAQPPAPSSDSGRSTGQVLSDSALDARTAQVAATLRCPVCQGESIQDSPSSLAREMRGVVKDKLRAGESPEAIQAYFVARYGEWILLEPTTKGLNLMLYLFPVILVVGGVLLVVFLVRRWSGQPATPATPTDNP